MVPLSLSNTARLQFRVGEADYDHLFDNILHANQVINEIKDMTSLPNDEMKTAVREKIKQIEATLVFIKTYVSPKEVDPNITAVIYAETLEEEPVGRVIINHLGTAHPTIDIRVLPEKQHQGYGYEMLKAIITAAFDQKIVDHLEYDVLTSNTASLGLVRKLDGELIFANESGEMYVFYPPDTSPSV